MYGGCGTAGDISGCIVAVEELERDQVVWWLWNSWRHIRLYSGCGTAGERSVCMVAVEQLERESGPKNGCGATTKTSGGMVVLEPRE